MTFLDLSWTVMLCLNAWFDSGTLIGHVLLTPEQKCIFPAITKCSFS